MKPWTDIEVELIVADDFVAWQKDKIFSHIK